MGHGVGFGVLWQGVGCLGETRGAGRGGQATRSVKHPPSHPGGEGGEGPTQAPPAGLTGGLPKPPA